MASESNINATEILEEAMSARKNIKTKKLRIPENPPGMFDDFHKLDKKDMQVSLANMVKGCSRFVRLAYVVVLDDDTEEDLVVWDVGVGGGRFSGLENTTIDNIANVLAGEITKRAARKKIKHSDRIEVDLVYR